jgi:hypothetical protein
LGYKPVDELDGPYIRTPRWKLINSLC